MARRKFLLFVVLPVSVLLALTTVQAVGDGGSFFSGSKPAATTSTTPTTSPAVATTSPEPPTTVQAAVPTPASPHTVKNGYSVIPRHDLTPGARDGRVTQANIDKTICTDDWDDRNRPSASFTTPTKTKQIAAYGYSTYAIENFELDHLVPIELGGDPTAIPNLWPEPWEARRERLVPHGWGAETKNALESHLHRAVCAKEIPLAEAQQAVAGDWIAAAKRYGIPAGEQVSR